MTNPTIGAKFKTRTDSVTYKARQWLDLGLISLQYRQLYFFFGHKSLFENRKKWNINWGTFVLEPGYREEERTSTGRFVGKVNLNWKYIFPTNLNCSQCISCSPGSDTIIWEAFFATCHKVPQTFQCDSASFLIPFSQGQIFNLQK